MLKNYSEHIQVIITSVIKKILECKTEDIESSVLYDTIEKCVEKSIENNIVDLANELFIRVLEFYTTVNRNLPFSIRPELDAISTIHLERVIELYI